MKRGGWITAIVAILGVAGVLVAFSLNASPYGSFADARNSPAARLHVPGDLDKSTVAPDVARRLLRFEMTDLQGERARVVYQGPPPANLGEATQVVAIGKMVEGEFHSDKLLIKCPSKYESAQPGRASGAVSRR